MSKPLTDAELELEKARHMARSMDLILGALFKDTTREIDATCPLCGCRTILHTRDPKAPGAVMAVCNRCSEGDRPASHDYPDTAW